jgi:hypothetical protein
VNRIATPQNAMTKKPRKTSRKAMSPLLEKILSDRSNVVFNVPKKVKKIGRDFFDNPRLNKAIIFKYPNFETDIDEFIDGGGSKKERPVETCLYFPYDTNVPQDGGHGVYLREQDFSAKLKYFIGIDLDVISPENARDLELLSLLDDIPSLDPFLMRVKFDEARVGIDAEFLGLDKVEELNIKSIVTRDVYPIITKAFPPGYIEKRSRSLSDFINSLWKAQSAEAELFIESFKIDKSLSNRILTAWKGVAYYEYKYSENIRRSTEIIKWLASPDSDPYDLAMVGHMKELYSMHKRTTIEQIRGLTRSTINIFKSYRECHTLFMERNDPGPFRDFLSKANERFWALGFCVNALDHCNYIFETDVMDKPGMKLRSDQFEVFLNKLNATIEANSNPEQQLN